MYRVRGSGGSSSLFSFLCPWQRIFSELALIFNLGISYESIRYVRVSGQATGLHVEGHRSFFVDAYVGFYSFPFIFKLFYPFHMSKFQMWSSGHQPYVSYGLQLSRREKRRLSVAARVHSLCHMTFTPARSPIFTHSISYPVFFHQLTHFFTPFIEFHHFFRLIRSGSSNSWSLIKNQLVVYTLVKIN